MRVLAAILQTNIPAARTIPFQLCGSSDSRKPSRELLMVKLKLSANY